MILPKLNQQLAIDINELSPGPYPMNGFLPVMDAQPGNGDCFGLYWPLGGENAAPIVCEMYHDEWRVVPAFSNVEKLVQWLEINDYEPYDNNIPIEDAAFAATYFVQAQTFLSEKKLDESIPLLALACQQLPEISDYWFTLATQYRRLGRLDLCYESALNAYSSNWVFGLPNIKLIHLLKQAQNSDHYQDDPVIKRVAEGRLDLNFGSVKENSNYPQLLECIAEYFSIGQQIPALRLMQNYAYMMCSETSAFQARYQFDLTQWRIQFQELCLQYLGDDRCHVVEKRDK